MISATAGCFDNNHLHAECFQLHKEKAYELTSFYFTYIYKEQYVKTTVFTEKPIILNPYVLVNNNQVCYTFVNDLIFLFIKYCKTWPRKMMISPAHLKTRFRDLFLE